MLFYFHLCESIRSKRNSHFILNIIVEIKIVLSFIENGIKNVKRLFPANVESNIILGSSVVCWYCSLLFVIKFNKNQKKIDHLTVSAINKPTVQPFRICFFF